MSAAALYSPQCSSPSPASASSARPLSSSTGRSKGLRAVRQLASRARRHVRGQSRWPAAGAAEHRRVVESFASAAASGDLAALIGVLDPDVVLVSDGGGLVTSARRPVLGADRVARFLLGILAREQPGDAIDRVVVNGARGFAVYQQGQLVTIVSVTAAPGRVTRLDLIRAPGKLPRLPR